MGALLAPAPAFAYHSTGDPANYDYATPTDIKAGFTITNPHLTQSSGSPLTSLRYHSRTSPDPGTSATGTPATRWWLKAYDSSGALLQDWVNTGQPWTSAGTLSTWPVDDAQRHKTLTLANGLLPVGTARLKFEIRDSATPSIVYASGQTWEGVVLPVTPTGLGMISTSPGGKLLSYDQVAALGWVNGWTTEQKLTEMVAVTRGESSFRTSAVSYTGCCHGLMQVNTSVHPYTVEQMQDPYQNVTAGRSIFEAAGSWQPWQAYTGPDGVGSDGPWLDFEERAREAARRQIASGGAAYDSIANAPNTGYGSITIGWTDACAVSPPCSFDVQRRVGSGSWVTVRTGGTATTYVDQQALDGTEYGYRVRSTNTNGESDWTAALQLVTGDPDPSAGWTDVDPEDLGGDEDGSSADDGTSCWSINPLTVLKCALRWAFVPGDAFSDQWTELKDNLATRPPFSIAFGGFLYAAEIFDAIQEHYDIPTGTDFCYDLGDDMDAAMQGDAPDPCFGPAFQSLSGALWLETLRVGMTIAMYVGAAMLVWRIMRSAFSSAPEVEGGEPLVARKEDESD